MSDYISKSALIEEIKKQKADNDLHCRLCHEAMVEIVGEQPTLDETEIIRKPFERVVEKLGDYTMWKKEMIYDLTHRERMIVKHAIKIVKEECGINE